MPAALRNDQYDWAGGREAMLRFGPDGAPTALVAQPLFEEANRTRAVLVAMLRALAAYGIGGALPDLPGQGDSLIPTREATLRDWRRAFAAAAASIDGSVHVVAVRGGALIDGDGEAASRWYCSPVEGPVQIRELTRLGSAASGNEELFAGNALSPALRAEIETARPMMVEPLRVVRLAGDPRPADARLDFAPPWRTAEPQRHDALAAALAADVAPWINSCAVR